MRVVGDVDEEAVAGGGDRGVVRSDVRAADGQAEEVTQEFLGLPARVDLPAVGAHVVQLRPQKGALVLVEVLSVAAQEFADGVDAVALAGPAAVLPPGEASAQVGKVALGELDDVEAVDDHGRVRQGTVDGGAEGGAQVDGDVAHLLAPGGGLGAEPVGDRRRVATLGLAEQAASADRVDETDVPGVRDEFPLLCGRVLLPHRLAAPGLVDPDRLGCGRGLGQDLRGVVLEALLHDGPAQGQVAAGLHDGAAAVAHCGPRRVAQGPGGPHPGRDLADRLGERATRAGGFGAVPACLAPPDTHRATAAGQVPGPGGAVALQPGGEDPAGGAGPGRVLARDDVHRRTARSVILDLDHTHPLQRQKSRGRLVDPGIVDVQARGVS